jgi:hypothetical protein
MVFIETSLFTKYRSNYLNDEAYRTLQDFLMQQPGAGDIIQGTGGLRKLRWSLGSKGKRGGIRIIYFFEIKKSHIYLMTLYSKNEMLDLSVQEKKLLKQLLQEW